MCWVTLSNTTRNHCFEANLTLVYLFEMIPVVVNGFLIQAFPSNMCHIWLVNSLGVAAAGMQTLRSSNDRQTGEMLSQKCAYLGVSR